jgi:hypothetical protein
MATGIDLSGLIQWGQRDEWKPLWEEVFLDHVQAGCESLDLEPDELMSIIGEHHFLMLWRCAFEDFLTRSRESDGQTIATDYIKRRGWKESVSTKRYIQQLETSVIGLYEVGDIVSGEAFLARDLMRPVEPVRVSEHSEARTPKPGDRIGTRLIELGGKTVMTGSMLVFDAGAADRLLDALARMQDRTQQELERIAKDAGRPRSDASARLTSGLLVHMRAAPVFSRIWLEHNVPRLLGLKWPIPVDDPDDELSGLSPKAEAERFRHELAAYYREMLDLPQRMLDGASPRAAARTSEGREKVVAWLNYLEHRNRLDPDDEMVSYDFAWMWSELGVLDRRR